MPTKGNTKHTLAITFTTDTPVSTAEAVRGLRGLFNDRLNLLAKPLWNSGTVKGNTVYGSDLKIKTGKKK